MLPFHCGGKTYQENEMRGAMTQVSFLNLTSFVFGGNVFSHGVSFFSGTLCGMGQNGMKLGGGGES